MTQRSTAYSRYSEQFHLFERNTGVAAPAWIRDVRKNAFLDFERLRFPTARKGNESWKYTNVGPLADSIFDLAAGARNENVNITAYELPCPRVHQVVFVDGHYEPSLSTEPPSEAHLHTDIIGHRGDGPVVGRLADAIEYRVPLVEKFLGRLAGTDTSGFTALNTAFLHDGAFVHIPAGVSVAEPIYLLFVSTGRSPIVTHPRTLVVAGPGSSATVLEAYECLDNGVYFTNAVTEVFTENNSKLLLCNLQRESSDAFHISTTWVAQSDSSQLASVTVDLGGKIMRRDLNVRLTEPGARVGLYGLYQGSGKQHVDNHVAVDHVVPDTGSNQVYKGVLDGASHGVFVGQVLVRPDAQRAEAHQVNKNLLLSTEAAVDTQPKLEIFADDVACTHGTAVGQIDQDALFYLQSRGIGSEAARRLLVHGFVSEVVDSIDDDAVRQYIDRAVSRYSEGASDVRPQ